MRSHRSPARSRSAFTLIEILLAIGILSIGITAVLAMFTIGARAHRRASDRTRAAMLADTVVHQLEAELVDPLPADRFQEDGDQLRILDKTTGEPVANATHADFPEFFYNVAMTKLSDGYFYKVKVVVRWGEPNEPPEPRNSETFETILRRRNS